MSDIYISKIHGAKLKDEELTQKVSEGLVEHENKLELLFESIPYEWQYTDGRALLHYDWDNGCFGWPYQWDVTGDEAWVCFVLDTDGYGLYYLDAYSYKYEDIEGGGRRWYFKIPHNDTVVDGYYVFAAESGSEDVKQTGYGTILYQLDWEDKEDKEVLSLELYNANIGLGVAERGNNATITVSEGTINVLLPPEEYTFDSVEAALAPEIKVTYDGTSKNFTDVSELVTYIKGLGISEYKTDLTYAGCVALTFDLSANYPLTLKNDYNRICVIGKMKYNMFDAEFIGWVNDGSYKVTKRVNIANEIVR